MAAVSQTDLVPLAPMQPADTALTELYGAPVDVFHTQGRVIVVAATDPGAAQHDPHAHQHQVAGEPA